MNTKYLLRHPHSSFAADRARAVVRQFIASAIRLVDAVGGGSGSSSCKDKILSGCVPGNSKVLIHDLHSHARPCNAR